jgi:hypothetical protein
LLLAVVALCSVFSMAVMARPHPVGSARTYDSYQRQADSTAESTLSALQTALLGMQTANDKGTFGPYLATLLSEQEDAISGSLSTFASIQPPNERADELRGSLTEIAGDALDHVSQLRIAARRGESQQPADSLRQDIAAVDDFLAAHQ